MKKIHSLFAVATMLLISGSCNNNPKEPGKVSENTINSPKNYEGTGPLRMVVRVDGDNMETDSAKYTVNEYGGIEIEAWGQRLTEGTDAYTYTLKIRCGNFQGAMVYPIVKESNSMFWQHKSYYADAAKSGSLLISQWDDSDIKGSFDWPADDGYGAKKNITGTFTR